MRHAERTITVFNKLYDANSGTDNYIGTTIFGCSWFGRAKTAPSGDGGLISADEYIVRIPTESAHGYVDPKVYKGELGTWTLEQGDIIVKEIVDISSPRPKDLFEKYSDTMTVLSVTDNRDGRGGHIKVVGK